MIFTTWKTKDKETPIKEMDRNFVLKAAKQCMRKMHYYNDQMEFLKQLRKEKPYLYTLCTKDMKELYHKTRAFAHLLEQLDNRALELGFEIPETIEDLTALMKLEADTISINEPIMQ